MSRLTLGLSGLGLEMEMELELDGIGMAGGDTSLCFFFSCLVVVASCIAWASWSGSGVFFFHQVGACGITYDGRRIYGILDDTCFVTLLFFFFLFLLALVQW